MIRALLGVVALTGCGAVPARALVARPLEALAAGPVLGAVLLSAAGAASVATSTPPLPWAAVVVVGSAVLAWRRAPADRWQPSAPLVPALVLLAVLAVPAVVYLVRPPIDWDAHSIWLHHGSWFHAGGSIAHDAFAGPTFSHPEYPPLLTASSGIVSRVVGDGFDWRVAQVVIAVVGWSALGVAGLAVLDTVRRPWLGVAGVAAVAAYAAAVLYVGVADAEADFAAATTVGAAAVLLLVRLDRRRVALGLAMATAAALCKGESFVAVTGVVLLAWLAAGRPKQWRWLVPTGAGVAWTVLARALGAKSYLLNGGSLTVDRFLDRAGPTTARVWHEMGTIAPAALVVGAGCVLLLPAQRGAVLRLAVAAIGSAAGLIVVFVFGDVPLESWLDSAARRTSMGPALLLALLLVLAIDACADLALGGPEGTPSGRAAVGRGSASDRAQASRRSRGAAAPPGDPERAEA